jgi:hypothetical protein
VSTLPQPRALALGALVLAGVIACAPTTRRPLTEAERAHVDECQLFAEETAPRVALQSTTGRRSVGSAPEAESFKTLFELCMQSKDALLK